MQNTMYVKYINVMEAELHLYSCRLLHREGETVDLLLATIASREKSSNATEAFIMQIIHSNQRAML